MQLIFKGFIIGVAKIIPGVSGAMLAISMGIYEKALDCISNFTKNIKQNIKFLLPIAIGLLLAIILASKVVDYFLTSFYLPTMLLFIGLIFGGIPNIYKKVQKDNISIKHIIVFILSFASVFLISLIGEQSFFTNYSSPITCIILFFIIGLIDAVTMVVPGISGTAIMMLLGCYHLLIKTLASLTSLSSIMQNLIIIIPFGLGVLTGVLLLAKIMNYLFQRKQTLAYSGILGFALSSVITLLFSTFSNNYNIVEIIVGLILLVGGYFISIKLDHD